MYKKIINYFIIIFSSLLYIYFLFFSKMYNNVHKELGYIYIVILPCIVLLLYSFFTKSINEKKKILKLYMLLYLIIMMGFVFANFRTNVYTEERIMTYEVNLIPFKSIFNLINNELGLNFGIYNIVGNFLMLTPFAILLPAISDKFKKTICFLISVILISFSIEILQYIFNIGSFDIDDIILNCIGAIIVYFMIYKTKISKYIENIFLEFYSNKRIIVILYWLFVILSFGIFIINIFSILEYREHEKIFYENNVCLSNDKMYITSFNNYDYYSNCTYDNLIIKQYNSNYTLKQFIEMGNLNSDIMDDLNISKEIIVTDFLVSDGNSIKKIFTSKKLNSEYYYYNINEIYYIKNGNKINLIDGLTSEDINIFNFVKIINDKSSKGYSILNGDKFDVVSCSPKYSDYSINYICPNYELFDYNICNDD